MFVISNEHSIHQLLERLVYICLYLYEILLVFKESNVHRKKSLKIPKMVNRRTDSTMVTRKRTHDDLQNTTQKLKFERHEPQKNQD